MGKFQETFTKEEFMRKLREVYCPREEWWKPWVSVGEKEARIRKRTGSDQWYVLRFCEQNQSVSAGEPPSKISGMKIVLDPGHIGGDFSEMEGRHFAFDGDDPVKEGDLALSVALRLRTRLKAKGAKVFLTRKENKPVTSQKPDDFKDLADLWAEGLNLNPRPSEEDRREAISKRRDLYFYRVSEIIARSEIIREIQPDLVLCLHLNAAPWPNPERKSLVDRNDYHVLVNGCYMGGELAFDDQRFEMIRRLLSRWDETERVWAENLAVAFAETTGLPDFAYSGPNALKIGGVDGVWARNLLANRIFEAPVVFLENYVAN